MNEENHKGWKLVSGVRKDVTNLFKSFANTNSVRFEDFCKVWKEMNFSLIFSNRTSFIELLEFSEELLQIVKEYLLSVYEFHTRVAALYALYGLYFKQPIKGAAKIRFTKTEWEEIYNLVEISKAEKHFDVAFIFFKLYLSDAFNFVATIRPAGLESGFRKYSEKRSALLPKVWDVELLYRPLISEKLVNSLVKLESLYCQKKTELLGNKNLVFIDGKFAESLKDELKKYESSVQGESNVKNPVQAQTSNENNTEKEIISTTRSEEDSIQPGTSAKRSKPKKNTKSDNDDEEIQNKKKKFSKKQLELVAKKKAEYYIQKLKSEELQLLEGILEKKKSFNQYDKEDRSEKNLSLFEFDELNFSD